MPPKQSQLELMLDRQSAPARFSVRKLLRQAQSTLVALVGGEPSFKGGHYQGDAVTHSPFVASIRHLLTSVIDRHCISLHWLLFGFPCSLDMLEFMEESFPAF
jgi:hypothetical protein